MEGKWELADDDKTVLVEPGKGVIAYFRYAKDAEMAVKAPAMAEALEKLLALIDRDAAANEANYATVALAEPEVADARALLAAIKGDAASGAARGRSEMKSCRTCALYDLDALRDKAGRVRAKGAIAKCGWVSTEPYPASVRSHRPTALWMGANDGTDCACWRPREREDQP